MVKGWIKIYRKLEDNVLWKNNEPFDRRSAWIDLLLMANYEDTEILFDGKPFIVKRGECLTSVRKLGVKWSWSKDRVLKFLRLIESIGMITKTSTNKRTLITIVNYDIYQSVLDADKDTDKDTDQDTDKDTGSPQYKKYKNSEEHEESKELKKKESVSDKSDTLSGKPDDHGKNGNDIKTVLEYLNQKTGKRFSLTTESNKKYVRARMREGFTVDDFKRVIDIKCSEWLGKEQAQYLRPETLFSAKHFESYLNQGFAERKMTTQEKSMANLQKCLEEMDDDQ